MRLMKTVIAAMLLICVDFALANEGSADLQLRTVDEIGSQATSSEGPLGEPAVKIVGSDTSSTSQLVICDAPSVTSHDYIVRGRVKYDGVQGDGYLELLNNFGKQGTFFSRTLSSSGTMKKLNGTSDWREFELPFHSSSGMAPQRLTLNVVLPGEGTVTVAQPVTLSSIKSSGQWWSGPQSGVIGGFAGSAMGILGGLIGLAAWKKSRRLTFGLCLTGILFGCAALISGLIAIGIGQPFHVYYPLLLIGAIGLFVIGFNFQNLTRQIRADELRRMQAADAV